MNVLVDLFQLRGFFQKLDCVRQPTLYCVAFVQHKVRFPIVQVSGYDYLQQRPSDSLSRFRVLPGQRSWWVFLSGVRRRIKKNSIPRKAPLRAAIRRWIFGRISAERDSYSPMPMGWMLWG